MTIRRAAALLLMAPVLILAIPQAILAEDATALDAAHGAPLEADFEQAREQLKLTPEQEAALQPILEDSARQRRAVFARYGIDESRVSEGERLKFGQLRALGKEMRKVQDATRDEVAAVLDADQMTTWEAMRKAYRDEFRRQLQARGNQ